MYQAKNYRSLLIQPPLILTYIRITLILFAYMAYCYRPWLGILFAIISITADAFDGMLARFTKKETYLGAALDMMLDRITTTLILFVIYHLMHKWLFMLWLLLVIDVASHIQLLQLMCFEKANRSTHKTLLLGYNRLLDLYYRNKYFRFVVLNIYYYFYVCIILYTNQPSNTYAIWALLLFPGFMFVNIVYVLQFYYASKALAKLNIAH